MLVTVPLPVPAGITVSAQLRRSKVAVTIAAATTVTVHVLIAPLHPPPDQPAKVLDGSATAVSVTIVAWS